MFAFTSLTNVFPIAVVMSLPVGNVTVIWLSARFDSVPFGDEVVKSTRYSERAPAAGVVTSVTVGLADLTARLDVVGPGGGRRKVGGGLDRERWGPAAGLMTPSNSISSWWPPGIVWPPLRLQVATTPDLLHPPTVALFAVTSLTNVFPSAVVMSLPVGNVTVIWLSARFDSVPFGDEVVKSTRYSERAPAAGVVTSVTAGWLI